MNGLAGKPGRRLGDGPVGTNDDTVDGLPLADTRAVYVISVAAELAGCHPQTLRIYERKGLLEPARTKGGSRRYSDADIYQLKRIQELTEAGYNLVGVKHVLELEIKVNNLQRELDRIQTLMVGLPTSNPMTALVPANQVNLFLQ